ncbi:MAG TPA: cyclopropane-fatty-acyl-phospholipid synthase family protein [Rhodospirillales bacterium]|nr:cyclopropane-fatty-acyl-phospholipid synthase family protein [Rhodospirillales bacterium]
MTSPSTSAPAHEPARLCAVQDDRAVPGDLWSRGFVRLAERIAAGELSVVFPNGGQRTFVQPEHGGPRAVLRINRTRALRRLAFGGDIGFAEAYMDGDWESPDLTALLELALVNEEHAGRHLEPGALQRLANSIRHHLRSNTPSGSRRNIAYHYDLSNAFYRLWLDEGMSYSSAIYAADDQPLAEAQIAKNRRLATLLGLRPGHHVLEIGCGWGGFAIMAARDYGCRVTAVTLSQAQRDHAQEQVRAAGLASRVEIRLQDYRDVTGRFDRVASTEMFEAVGERYWPLFFRLLRERLVAGGVAALQVITINEKRFATYRSRPDFIQKYIFPGGMLPSPTALRDLAAAGAFRLSDQFTFGASYARTLHEWQSRFQHAWGDIEALGFDRRFKRMWEYYLAYCEAGFRTGAIDVGQFRLVKS